ncbi:hypothetical protein [Burkholderia sp. BCC0419]|uniref:hypothetical protein n=1 Tax=Burkholderia sp. BCC0419 TaxID=486878 RepID=UPI001ABADCB8|nr:hypothetical protein [Burkholderia sp. BCC0419]
MNRHFRRFEEMRSDFPPAGYATVDHVEMSPRGDVIIALDVVDGDWFESSSFWQQAGISDYQHQKLLKQKLTPSPGVNPFEDASLYRVEVTLSPTDGAAYRHPFGYPHAADYESKGEPNGWYQSFERAWFHLSFSTAPVPGAVPANVYSNLFAPPTTVYVQGTMPSGKAGKLLTQAFSFAHLPTADERFLAPRLQRVCADLLAIYDVGQGNCNSFLKNQVSSAFPTLYYDLGAGVYRNSSTTPTNLVFCFSRVDTVILSHWDADHWAGAYAMMAPASAGAPGAGTYPALSKTWLAPEQKAGPVHLAFAYDIVANGGDVFIYKPSTSSPVHVNIAASRQLIIAVGNGGDRNNTGIVLMAEDTSMPPSKRWLLTGDCDYSYIDASQTDEPLVGLVAPHHGATLGRWSSAPAPDSGGYCRLAYSFGSDNKHGKNTQHPTKGGADLHRIAGWDHGAWKVNEPGDCLAGADVLHTEQHTKAGFGGVTGQLGGVVVGWTSAPAAPLSVPCGGLNCSTPVTQS